MIGLKQTESRISILASRHKKVYTSLPLLEPLRASFPSFVEPIQRFPGTMLLDGTKMRHVTIQKVEVYYNVGPLELEDVVFVDCEFVLSINDQARAFARAILIEGQVNWNSESPTHF